MIFVQSQQSQYQRQEQISFSVYHYGPNSSNCLQVFYVLGI